MNRTQFSQTTAKGRKMNGKKKYGNNPSDTDMKTIRNALSGMGLAQRGGGKAFYGNNPSNKDIETITKNMPRKKKPK